MEHQNILNLLNKAINSKYIKSQWNIINDVWSEIIYNKEILKSNLCEYNDAYILSRANITIIRHGET